MASTKSLVKVDILGIEIECEIWSVCKKLMNVNGESEPQFIANLLRWTIESVVTADVDDPVKRDQLLAKLKTKATTC